MEVYRDSDAQMNRQIELNHCLHVHKPCILPCAISLLSFKQPSLVTELRVRLN